MSTVILPDSPIVTWFQNRNVFTSIWRLSVIDLKSRGIEREIFVSILKSIHPKEYAPEAQAELAVTLRKPLC